MSCIFLLYLEALLLVEIPRNYVCRSILPVIGLGKGVLTCSCSVVDSCTTLQ